MRARIEAAFNLLAWPLLGAFAALLFGRRPTENDEADLLA